MFILGPETGTLDTVAVGCTTLATLLTIGLVEVLVFTAEAENSIKCYQKKQQEKTH